MALPHILATITAEADECIAAAAAAHADAVHAMESSHAQALGAMRNTVKQQKNERLYQLKKRAEGHVDMLTRHAVLQRKQELLEDFYTAVTQALGGLPAHDTGKLLSGWLKRLPEGGTIVPSKKHEAFLKKYAGSRDIAPAIASSGGFRYIGKTEDRDYTYEFLVRNVFRPDTEVEVSARLFGPA
jgi:vacuolar-type H+-ATPase subunit E/Vma4